MATYYYGPQLWTDGTFDVTGTPDSGDANYDFINYREEVKTVDASGPNSERIIDTTDYGASALDEENFGPTSGHFDSRGLDDGNGVFYEGSVKFSTAAEAVNGNFNYPFNVCKDSLLRLFFQMRVALTEGKLYINVKGDGEEATSATLSADDAWHTIKVQIVPSSDEGSTADGIVRVWLDDVSVYENLASFAWVNTTGTAYMLNYVAYGHFGILPSTNWRIYVGSAELQSVIIGRGAAADDKAKVTSDLTVLMNLDGLGRTVHEPNTLYVAGNLIVTGTTTVSGDVEAASPSTLMNSIVTDGTGIVLDSDGNVVFVNGS